MSESGMTELASPLPVAETVARLERFLAAKGMKIFARIDQAAEAAAVGLTLRPTVLLLFGNPKAGTPLMERFPELAMDLPLRVLIWQAEGGTKVGFVAPEALRERYGLAEAPFAQLPGLLAAGLNG